MNAEVIWEPEANHRTLPCFDRFTEMGTYFGGGYIILGLANFRDPDALFYVPDVRA